MGTGVWPPRDFFVQIVCNLFKTADLLLCCCLCNKLETFVANLINLIIVDYIDILCSCVVHRCHDGEMLYHEI